MGAYLKIENPGVAPEESFTLLGASTKRNNGNDATIGKFGTGNKMSIGLLLRHNLSPVIFAGNLKMEFTTRSQGINDGMKDHSFNRVQVKFGGKDRDGKSRTSTEDLGFVLEHGAEDWLSPELALREFVSNSLDRAAEESDFVFVNSYLNKQNQQTPGFIAEAGKQDTHERTMVEIALKEHRATATPYKDVIIEVVNESQVRAKTGTTRVFIPLNEAVLKFYNDLGKWFLHFSEPELLGKTILPKGNRNLGDRQSAVIYRRGVRVREFEISDTPSLFDYNLENLKLDESRKVDDWYVQYEAAQAIAAAEKNTVARLWQSFLDGAKYWEHGFSHYGLERSLHSKEQKAVWTEAFNQVAGEKAVLSTASGGELASRKGYKVVVAPESFVQVAEKYGVRTPSKVLSNDEQMGRQIGDATPDAIMAVDYVWQKLEDVGLTNGKTKPPVKGFTSILDGGTKLNGYYSDGIVYINRDLGDSGGGLSKRMLHVALEELAHYVTGSFDNVRDFQNYLLDVAVAFIK